MVMRNERRELIRQLLPDGIPRLWCPLLTHYMDDGAIDFSRMTAHYNHIVPWVKGYLMPGSTGDGWDLDHEETLKVADFAIRMARKNNTRVLLGALRPDTNRMRAVIEDMLGIIGTIAGTDGILPAFLHTHVCGFTICPPTGPSIDQGTIRKELSTILDMGVPTALYQLPQVTQNEASPETFAALAETYSNLIFFKDSSGKDDIVLSDADPRGVYLVRGAEGDYAHWLKDAGGQYDGFLLSTANCFPSHLMNIIQSLEAGDQDSARGLSDRISGVISEMFDVVRGVPCGNSFTNANKAIDHYCAFGPTAVKHGGPLLHGGVRLSADTLSKTGDILSRYDLMPARGYLE